MALLIAQRVRPFPGYEISGDGVVVRTIGERTLLAVVDGVGHGPHAAQATAGIVEYLQDASSTDLPTLLLGCDAAAAGTRGAAIGLLLFSKDDRRIHYLGVGNISAALWIPGEGSTTFVNQNGMIGRLRKVPPVQEYPTENHQLLLMHSDGLSTQMVHRLMQKWNGGVEAHADHIMDEASKRDDVSLLLAQIRHSPAA